MTSRDSQEICDERHTNRVRDSRGEARGKLSGGGWCREDLCFGGCVIQRICASWHYSSGFVRLCESEKEPNSLVQTEFLKQEQ